MLYYFIGAKMLYLFPKFIFLLLKNVTCRKENALCPGFFNNLLNGEVSIG